jgi:hypothetical protein
LFILVCQAIQHAHQKGIIHRDIIREREPLRPSTRLNTLPGETRTTAGKRRQTDMGKLVHQLQGDLDWIVMKCLEKDRTEAARATGSVPIGSKASAANVVIQISNLLM